MTGERPAGSPIEPLHVFVELLSDVETATSAFWGRLAEATCRLAGLRRAVIFLYDDARGRVRAVGSHGVSLELFEGLTLTPESAAIARRALELDEVLDAVEELHTEIPAEFVRRLGITAISCTPVSAGGRWFGVILADHEAEQPLNERQRETLWTLGKVSALAASARMATTQQERARQLSERIDLAREIHEGAVQRLFGVGLALSADRDLDRDERRVCGQEIQAALADLRRAVQRPLARVPRPTAPTLHDELLRLCREHADLPLRTVEGADVEVPARVDALAQSVLAEAVRNARKHARPSRIEVRLRRDDGTFVLEVTNDGAAQPSPGGSAAIGLRLAAFEALGLGGVVEFGPGPPDRWRVRLTVPVEEGE